MAWYSSVCILPDVSATSTTNGFKIFMYLERDVCQVQVHWQQPVYPPLTDFLARQPPHCFFWCQCWSVLSDMHAHLLLRHPNTKTFCYFSKSNMLHSQIQRGHATSHSLLPWTFLSCLVTLTCFTETCIWCIFCDAYHLLFRAGIWKFGSAST